MQQFAAAFLDHRLTSAETAAAFLDHRLTSAETAAALTSPQIVTLPADGAQPESHRGLGFGMGMVDERLFKLRVSDVAPGGSLRQRATVIQQKTGRHVPFEITDPTGEALKSWLALRGARQDDWLFPSRSRPGDHIGARQYARLVNIGSP